MKVVIGPYTEYDWKTGLQPDRKIKVTIHKYDTFSAYSTIAQIVHPLLVKFKKRTKSFAETDNEDAPEHLHTNDMFSQERWNHVLDEMIWAMNEIKNEYPNEPEVDALGSFDKYNAYDVRVANGCRLFGKYFQSLWS